MDNFSRKYLNNLFFIIFLWAVNFSLSSKNDWNTLNSLVSTISKMLRPGKQPSVPIGTKPQFCFAVTQREGLDRCEAGSGGLGEWQ